MELLLTRVSAARTRPAGTETDQAAPIGRAAALRRIGARPSCRAGPPGARTRSGRRSPPIKLDLRLIATRNRDLEAQVIAGRFREDLLFRLKVVNFHLPAWRARPADIAPRSILCRQSKPEPTPYQCVRREGDHRSLARTRGTAMSANSKAASNAARASRGRRDRPRGDPVSRRPQRLSPWRRRQERTGGAHGRRGRAASDFPQTLCHTLGNRTHAASILGTRSARCANKLRQYGNAGEPIAPPGGGGSDAVRRRLHPRTSCLEIGSQWLLQRPRHARR